MNVLVACEFSGIVREAFAKRGHNAWSCDLLPTEIPGKHLQADIIDVLRNSLHGYWDLIIMHPDCTALAVCGNRTYGRGTIKHQERLEAIIWTTMLWKLAQKYAPKVVLENPVSVIFQYLESPVQYIQPWQFGHGETKKTGLALHGVPPLQPTNIVAGREHRIWKMGPSPTRKQDRSRTYTGIAEAMAEQWG